MSNWLLRTFPDNSDIPYRHFRENALLAIGVPTTSDRQWCYGMRREHLWINTRKPWPKIAWRAKCFEYLLCSEGGMKTGDLVVAVSGNSREKSGVQCEALGIGRLGEDLKYEYDPSCPSGSENILPHTLGPVEWRAI